MALTQSSIRGIFISYFQPSGLCDINVCGLSLPVWYFVTAARAKAHPTRAGATLVLMPDPAQCKP